MSMEEMRSKLPSREELLERLPVRSARSHRSEEILAAVGVFGAGIVVGAGLALLFAPKPGCALRREIGEKVEHARSAGDGPAREPAQRAGA